MEIIKAIKPKITTASRPMYNGSKTKAQDQLIKCVSFNPMNSTPNNVASNEPFGVVMYNLFFIYNFW